MPEPKKRILYVDDEMINLELFRLSFNADFDIVLASSGYEGLEKYSKDGINLVVSDLKMPGMNGLEMIQEIKKMNSSQPCILLTAFMDPVAMMKAINDKLVYKYMLKPWKRDELKLILEEAMLAC